MRKLLASLMAVLFLCVTAVAQTTTVTGKVTDDRGAGLPNASVREKSTKNGVTAGVDGTFSIKVKTGATLIISAVGFESKEMAASGNLAVSLATDIRALNEVVVTGVGTATTRKKVAIAVQSLGADKLPTIPAASIDQALVGKIAGASITSTSGNPGSPVSIQFRGANTIQGGSEPMILLDGVALSVPLNTIDLNTIEKVEVVQGASGATQYGAQGANGVIQLFTKKGKLGATKINLSSRVSTDEYINLGNVHQAINHSFKVDGSGDILQGSGTDKLVQNSLGIWGNPVWLSGPNDQNNKPYKNNTQFYDHFSELFHKAQTTNHSVSVSGAKEKMDYALSLSQLRQESIIDGLLKRTNFTANIGFEVFKGLTVRSTTQLVVTENTTGNLNISSALYTYPFASFKYTDADGNHTYKFGGAGANSSNPYYYRQYRHYNDKYVDIIPSINANYKFPRFVELDYKYTIQQGREDYNRLADNQSKNKSSAANNYFTGEGLTGGIYNYIGRSTRQNSLATVNVKFDLAKDFHLNVPLVSTSTVAYDWRKRQDNSTTNQYTGLPLYSANANQADTKAVLDIHDETFVTYGTYFNQKFDYGEIGGVAAGYRSDYSSRFGQTGTPQNFWSGNAYFRPSSLNFWDGIAKWFPEFKIRAAHGEAGIQPGFSDRQILLNIANTDNGAAFYNPSLVGNTALVVERSKETEIGVDFSLKPGKNDWFSSVNLTATYWKRKGVDVIWNIPLAISTGTSQLKSNAVDLHSNGFELLLDANIFKSKMWSWNLGVVFGTQKTFTDAIYGTPDIPLVWSSAATYTLRPGEQWGTIYGYKTIKSFEQTDPTGVRYIAKANEGLYEIVDGRVVEKSSKRVQMTPDKYLLGNTSPKFNMSFTNSVSYKDIATLSFQFDWIAKALQYNQTKEWMYSEGLHGDFDKPVTINGQTGAWTAYYRSFYDASESNGTKEFFLENSSFVRLRNISLSVDVAKIVKIPFTNRLQVVFSGRNIWTNTKYTGLDPEANQNTTGAGSTSTSQTTVQKGLDYFSFPNTKSYQVGINIGLN
ncbi:MAG: SusC/RagA family TonB-linked outer membrane protein [Chitinophagaceae bacterium]